MGKERTFEEGSERREEGERKRKREGKDKYGGS